MTAYAELDGWPREVWGNGGFRAERKLMCAIADVNAVLIELAAAGGQIYPYRPNTLARAITAEVEGFGVIGYQSPNMGSYEWAIITVRYSTFGPHSPNGSTFVSEQLQPSGEFITLEEGDLRWDSDEGTALKDREAPGKFIPGFDYLVTFYYVDNIPAAADTLVDYCNSAAITAYTLGRTFAAETLLYRGLSARRDIQFGGAPSWRLTYRFSYRAVGWNVFWRAGASPPAFESIYHKDGGGSRYINHPLGNLSLLFV